MSAAVGAVVAFEGDLAALAETITSLRNQTLKPQEICVAISGASKEAEAWLRDKNIPFLEVNDSFSESVSAAISKFSWWVNDSDHFIWLLTELSLPAKSALAEMLRSVERSPSVAVVTPKLLRENRYLHQVGLTLTPWGGLFSPADGQLDQAQFDTDADTLAVSAEGLLVRADAWFDLDGFDNRFNRVAQSIDFSIRARLAGFRVEASPAAEIQYSGTKGFDPRLKRGAELEIKGAYIPPWLLVVYWLALPLWGVARAFYQIAAKHLELVSVELGASASMFIKPWKLVARNRGTSRRSMRQMRSLRATWAEVLAQRREVAAPAPVSGLQSLRRSDSSFWWFILLVALNLRFWPSGNAAVGGALKPLSENWLSVFSHAGASWQVSGFGASVPADPVNWVLATLSLVTFWSPSLAVSLFLVLVRALAFWGADRLLSRFTQSRTLARILAMVFAFWPALSSALLQGNLGATVSIVIAPWLLVSLGSLLEEQKTRVAWLTQVGISGLLLAATFAASPSTAPLWLLLAGSLTVFHRRRSLRLLWAAIPAAVIFAPLALFTSVTLGHPLLVLVDPLQAKAQPISLWQSLAGGRASLGADFWQLSSGWPLVAVLVCIALAVISVSLARNRLAVPVTIFFVLSVTYAWLVSHISVIGMPGQQNPEAILGLAGLSLLVLLSLGFESRKLIRVASILCTLLVLLPLSASSLFSSNQVRQTNGQVLPAIVQAEWQQGNHLKVLQLTGKNTVTAQLVTPENLALDGQSLGYRLSSKLRAQSQQSQQLSSVAANLVSASSTDLSSVLSQLGIGFVFAPRAEGSLVSALDSSPQLEAVGVTKLGRLWRVTSAPSVLNSQTPTQRQLWSVTKVLQLLILVVYLLMALPTASRTRRQRDEGLDEGEAIDAA